MMDEEDVTAYNHEGGAGSVQDPSTVVNTEVPVSVKDASNTS